MFWCNGGNITWFRVDELARVLNRVSAVAGGMLPEVVRCVSWCRGTLRPQWGMLHCVSGRTLPEVVELVPRDATAPVGDAPLVVLLAGCYQKVIVGLTGLLCSVNCWW
jgi:hypothetical protein